MIVQILRKILGALSTILGVALVVFLLFNVVGGDPVYQILGKHASEAQVATLRHELGLDQPLWWQFFSYLKQIATFDYGRSYTTHQPITQMIAAGIGPSLSVAIPAFFLTTVIAILLGLLTAYFLGRWVDRVVSIACVLGMSVPILAYILVGQSFFAFELNLFPISGYEADWPERLQYIALPMLIWITVSLGYDVRFFRTAMIEEVRQDYVRTARAKGVHERGILFKHVLKNSAVPLLTHIVVEIPMLILGSFLLESFFGIPGLGSMTIDALHHSDFPVIKAMTTLQSLLLIAGNLATDLLYHLVDPRMGWERRSA